MKQFEVKALGLEEMTISEKKSTNGGGMGVFALIMTAIAITELLYDVWEGYKEEAERLQNEQAGNK